MRNIRYILSRIQKKKIIEKKFEMLNKKITTLLAHVRETLLENPQ